jgi:hypothetical protein
MDERIPDTQPSGALVPPPRDPPTAVATGAPLPPRPPRSSRATTRAAGPSAWVGVARRAVGSALDLLDDAGDRVARAVGLRAP